MKQYNVMLKPASSLCNLRCRYCFYCDVADLREVRSFGYAELGSRPTPEEVLGRCAEEFARYAPEYYDESSK